MFCLWQPVGEEQFLPMLVSTISKEDREDMALRYKELKEFHRLSSELRIPKGLSALEEQAGRIGYLFAWIIGIPAWLLLMILLVRG
jgi:hypothetical protein